MLTELWSDLRYRLRALVRRGEMERQLHEELDFHIAREAEKYERLGMAREDAVRQARIAFGGVDRTKEESRDARGTVFLETLLQDLRYAARGLRARPAFTLSVMLTLGLGIGANAAMFDIIDRLLFRPPEYLHDAEQVDRVYLSRVRDRVQRISDGFQYPRYADLARWTRSFSAVAAYTSRQLAVGDGDAARERRVVGASASFFDFFDATPSLGRFFTAGEDSVPLGTPVAVIGHRFWQEDFGGRPDVLGRQLRVGHTLCTIIGVSPPRFRGVEETTEPDVYIPLSTFGMDARGPSYVANYGFHWLGMIVRRKAGVSRAVASADLTAAYQRSWLREAAAANESPSSITQLRAIAAPLQSARGPLAGPEGKLAAWAGGVTAIVLLIACANVANLLLARAIVRRRETALRCALGVSRGRLVRQHLTESLLLAGAGAAVGLLFAQWGGALMRRAFLPPELSSGVFGDSRMLFVVIGIAILAAAATGLAPVLDALNTNLTHSLSSGARDTGSRSSRGRGTLLVAQAALSVVLLVGAGLFVRSLQHVRALRLGYDVDPVLLVMVQQRGARLDSIGRIALEARLVEQARTLPGVVDATIASSVPFWGFEGRALYVAGIDSVDLLGNFDLQAVSPGYFGTVGTRILRGRQFDRRDAATSPPVTIVSEGMARALWPGQEPLGKCIRVAERTAPCATVVGVAEDLRLHTLRDARDYIYYLPITQFSMSTGMLFVRVHGSAPNFVQPLRRQLQSIMPGPAYVSVRPFSDVIDPVMRSWQIGATIFVAFGVLALALASVGLYSVIAYGVAQRRREIGVRIALGATRSSVVQLVVSRGVRLVALGIALGAVATLAAGRGIAALLFQESPNDPVVYVTVAAVLLGVSLLATAAPALSAARVDPNLSLRVD
ncbi:MAG TPA: ABC transporter permease [Gemmatimonadaceae bacterium]|nr:ABC transporter permease [Gemmatimonadaceae bacterium]